MIGAIISLILIESPGHQKVQTLMSVSDIENLSSKIYKTGNYESSIIVLNFLVDKLKQYENIVDKQDLISTLRIDRGLAHGRLYVLYKRKSKEDLAQKEYINAIELLKEKYHITSEKRLKEAIEAM